MNESGIPVKHRIMVVDDEEPIRLIGKMMLERLGYEAITAPGGREALTIYQDQSGMIDLVILDLTMPLMDGEQTYRELIKINPSARIIISSGYGAQDMKSVFSSGGQVDFIQKPFTITELGAKIQTILAINP